MLVGFFSFAFFFVTASIGLVALALFPDIAADQSLPTVVMRLMPVGLIGLVVAALLAVVMSTASSYLNSVAVVFVFVKDIYQPFVRPDLSMTNKLWLERGLSLVVGVAATLFAISVPSIVDALVYSYSFWAPTVIIPLIAAVLLGARSTPAALAAIVAGGVTTAVWTWGWDEPLGLSGLVAGVAANLVVFVVVSLVAPGNPTATPARLTPEEVS